MACKRFTIDLSVEDDVYDSIPVAKKIAFRNEVRALKNFALNKEGVAIKATWHHCFHDETPPQPCESEQEI